MKILFAILFLTLTACGHIIPHKLSEKNLIHIDSVETIYIDKSSTDEDYFSLNEGQKKAFIDKWNSSESVGINNFSPDYWIIIKEKNGSIRKFRTHKDIVKETDELAFSVRDTLFIDTLWNSSNPFPNPEQSNPISFIRDASRIANSHNGSAPYIVMNNSFPIDWVKSEHIDTLITFLDSKDSCACYINPLSSYIPNGYAEKGAYAAIFIKSYKDKQAVSFGLYACPKIDEQLNNELIEWWTKFKGK